MDRNSSTLTPVLVASREASSNGSNIGLNATVKAQSTINPVNLKTQVSDYSIKEQNTEPEQNYTNNVGIQNLKIKET